MQRARPQLSLTGRALRYLSQREHSRSELERKLARHAETPEDIPRVLDELQARGFIDHERVAVAVASLNASEFERAREVWRRRFGALPQDAGERAKQARFLAARGFGGEVVRRVLNTPDDE